MIRTLTARERKILVLTVVIVSGCLFYQGFMGPLAKRDMLIRQEIEIQKRQWERGRDEIQSGLARENRYEEIVRQFRQPGSAEETSSLILSEIEKAAGELGVSVIDLKPAQVQQGSFHNQFSTNLTIHGRHLIDVIRFLYTVQKEPRFFHVGRMEFEPSDRADQEGLTMRLVLEKNFLALSAENAGGPNGAADGR